MLVLGQRSIPATILAKERFSGKDWSADPADRVWFGTNYCLSADCAATGDFSIDFVKFCVIQLALCKADRFEIGVAEGSKIADARFKCTVTKITFCKICTGQLAVLKCT